MTSSLCSTAFLNSYRFLPFFPLIFIESAGFRYACVIDFKNSGVIIVKFFSVVVPGIITIHKLENAVSGHSKWPASSSISAVGVKIRSIILMYRNESVSCISGFQSRYKNRSIAVIKLASYEGKRNATAVGAE